MRKIPTLFVRNLTARPVQVIDEVLAGCEWVFDDTERVRPTRKWDGTCCKIKDGKLYKRDRKREGWLPVCEHCMADPWHCEAWDGSNLPDGTYELCGPKVQGNPDGFEVHTLVRHGEHRVCFSEPWSYDSIKRFLRDAGIEGIVFYHEDGRMAKIKRRDFDYSVKP